MISRVLVLFAVLAVALAQQWSIDSTTTATFVVGVGVASPSLATAAAGQNGVGSIMERYNGNEWVSNKVNSLMVLATSISSSGIVVATGVNRVLISNDGVTFNSTSVSGLSQSANVFGANNDKFALVGSWMTTDSNTGRPTYVYGVASSADAGSTFSISSSISDGYVRYGAFPSDSTWYVSSGIWGEDPAASLSSKLHRLTSRVSVDTATQNVVFNTEAPKPREKKVADTNTTGWFGSVSKTTDGGKTWTSVFSTNLETDYVYFNEISCGSETNCVVVGEGDDGLGGYLTVAYTTLDGGNTWEKTFSSNEVSLMSVKFTSEKEAWMLGTSKSGRNLYGQFRKTTDGGKTWSLAQSLNNCMGLDVDAAQGASFAVCCNSSGTGCSVASYK